MLNKKMVVSGPSSQTPGPSTAVSAPSLLVSLPNCAPAVPSSGFPSTAADPVTGQLPTLAAVPLLPPQSTTVSGLSLPAGASIPSQPKPAPNHSLSTAGLGPSTSKPVPAWYIDVPPKSSALAGPSKPRASRAKALPTITIVSHWYQASGCLWISDPYPLDEEAGSIGRGEQ